MTATGGISVATGWMSRFDVALRTRRRVVLYGNVLDHVFDESFGSVLLIDWIRERLRSGGFQRVVHYDHVHPPQPLCGEVPAVMRGLAGMPPARVDATLEMLERVLAEAGASQEPSASEPLSPSVERSREPESIVHTGLILSNAEHLIRHPSRESALLHSLGSGRTHREAPRSLVVHLYTRDSAIPPEFVTADPDTALILVPPPSFSQRMAYFNGLGERTVLLQIREHDAQITTERLARVTEGYRLRELQQLVELAEVEGTDGGLNSLLSLFRFGRKYDYWAGHRIGAIISMLRQVVLGQDEAVDQVQDSLYRAKQHVDSLIDDTGRHPAMVLFFVGATGVGKTLMARAICEAVTGTGENLKIFDMSEFQREHSDQRLIGSPPGYIGYEEGGQLTNWVQERPHSVVLIDEVEKAHERILDLFLQILDGARLTNGKGVTVDFSETILVFTSNLGTEDMDAGLDKSNRKAVVAHFKSKVEEYFSEDIGRPELFNRLKKGIVVFNFIPEEMARKTIQDKLRSVAEGVERRLSGMPSRAQIVFDPTVSGDGKAADELLKHSNVQKYGLRDVNTVLIQLVGAAVGRFLDFPPEEGEYCFYWDAEAGEDGKVRIHRNI